MANSSLSTRRRRGVTLIELLVVVSILLMLAVVALPRVQPAMEKREVREAARATSVFFGAARNHAIEIRRPVGVLIQRFGPQQPNAGTVLQQVEIPPPYGGDTLDTKISLRVTNVAGNVYTLRAELTGLYTAGTIRRGDLLQVNYQGLWYRVSDAVSSDNIDERGYIKAFPIYLQVTLPTGASLPWPTGGGGSGWLAFTVMRQPLDTPANPLLARRSAASSLTLSRNVAIDLLASGTDSAPLAFAGGGSTIIIFAPTGAVGWVINGGTQSPVLEPIHLLVGKWGRLGMPDSGSRPATIPNGWTPAEDAFPNWLDPESLWVTLNPHSGMVNVGQNQYITPPAQDSTTGSPTYFLWDSPATWGWAINAVRGYARQSQVNHGGR